MVFMYKALYSLIDCFLPLTLDLSKKTSRFSGEGIKLNQHRFATHASFQLSAVCAPSAWTKLSLDITGCISFQKFKRLLKTPKSAEQ